MKHLTLLFFLLGCFITSSAQQVLSVTLFFEDNVGRKDTVVFGIYGELINGLPAQVGIDSSLGEINIYG